MSRWRASILFLSLALAACGSPGAGLRPIDDISTTPSYHLGPGDRVRVIVFGMDAISNVYSVGDTGAISMPLLGAIQAGGLTASELEERISAQIVREQLRRDPSTNVQIEQYRPFFVLGEVQRPGQYPYVPGMSLKTAVAIAGGYTFRAEEDYAAVTRSVDDRVIEGRALPTTAILPGDTIYIYESWF